MTRLYGDDAYKVFKKELQEYAKSKGIKLSIKKNHHSSYSIALMACDEQIIEEDHIQVNQYYIDRDERITDYGKKIMNEINDIIRKQHWDDSDLQTDYFHAAFYYDLSIGKWDQPFKVTEKKAQATPNLNQKGDDIMKKQEIKQENTLFSVTENTEKKGIEVLFNEKPGKEVLSKLKDQGFRWHGVKKIWYAKDTQERRDFLSSLEIDHATPKMDEAKTPATPIDSGKGFKVIENTEKQGLEIVFTEKPAKEVLMKLKENGFRWHNAKKLWYVKDNAEVRAALNSL